MQPLFHALSCVDSIGLHRVENISHTESAVSLHLYSPPFDSCNTFDQRTGHKHKVKMTFYSQFGERTLCVSRRWHTLLQPLALSAATRGDGAEGLHSRASQRWLWGCCLQQTEVPGASGSGIFSNSISKYCSICLLALP